MNILTENGETFDLTPNFELNIEETNPFLTDQGSVSLSVEIPGTPRNLSLLDFPERFERVKKIKKKRKAFIQNGSYIKESTMNIYEIDSAISSYFLLNESSIYSKLKEQTMSLLFRDIVRDPYSGTVEEKITSWINYLTQIMIGEAVDEFHVFPICTKISEITSSIKDRDKEFKFSFLVYEYLNGPATNSNSGDIERTAIDSNGNEYFLLRGSQEWTTKDQDKVEMAYPKGYGITPFLKYSVVLRKIFNYFGYSLSESLFDTDSDLKDLVLMNNTADTLLKGVLDYSQLVPSCQVNDFLDSVRADFGCEFIVFESKKTVEIRFFNDLISSIPDMDMTERITSKPKLTLADPQQIKLSANRLIEYSETSFNSYQEMVKTYGEPIFREYYSVNSDSPEPGFYFFANRNAFYKITEKNDHEFIAYNVFDYFGKEEDDIEYKEYTSKREHIAMTIVDFSKIHPIYSPRSGYIFSIPFIGERRHLNSVLQLTTTTDDESKVTEKSDNQDKCPILAAFYAGRAKSRFKENSRLEWETKVYYGSTSRYDNIGQPRGNLSLAYQGEDGLYTRFWKQWDDVIKNSFHKITISVDLTPNEIMNFRMDRTKILNYQNLIPASIKYTSNENGLQVEEIELYTTRIYK